MSGNYGMDIRQFFIKPRSKVVQELKAKRRSAVRAVEAEMDDLLTRLDPVAPVATVLSDEESDDELVFKSPPPPTRDDQRTALRAVALVPTRGNEDRRRGEARFDTHAEVFEQTFEQELAVAEIGA